MEEYFAAIERLCDAIMKKYKTTPATAAECLDELDTKLLEMGMEPDCVGLWQTLYQMKEEEEEWENFSAEQQQGKDVPKGKSREPVASIRRSRQLVILGVDSSQYSFYAFFSS